MRKELGAPKKLNQYNINNQYKLGSKIYNGDRCLDKKRKTYIVMN